MPTHLPMPTKAAGDLFPPSLWNDYLRDNINKLLNLGHRVLTVAQFLALTGLEDGDEVYVEVDATNGIQWHLRYHLSSTKWRFLGGPPMRSEVTTSESTSSTSYADLSTVGPSIIAPLTGVYRYRHGAQLNNTGVAGSAAWQAVKLGAASTLDADGVAITNPTLANCWTERVVSCTAADVLKCQYKASSSSAFANGRRLNLEPERIG